MSKYKTVAIKMILHCNWILKDLWRIKRERFTFLNELRICTSPRSVRHGCYPCERLDTTEQNEDIMCLCAMITRTAQVLRSWGEFRARIRSYSRNDWNTHVAQTTLHHGFMKHPVKHPCKNTCVHREIKLHSVTKRPCILVYHSN